MRNCFIVYYIFSSVKTKLKHQVSPLSLGQKQFHLKLILPIVNDFFMHPNTFQEITENLSVHYMCR